MSTPLPSRPNLEHLRNEARSIMKSHTSGDRTVCGVLRGLRRFSGFTDDSIMAAEVTLQEVQLALAVNYGYKDWAALKTAVEGQTAVEAQMPKPSPESIAELEKILASGPASGWPASRLVDFYRAAAGLWRDLGMLGRIAPRIDDPFIRGGLELLVADTSYEVLRPAMTERKRTALAEDERRYEIGITALVAIGWAEHPRVLEERCRALLPQGAPSGKPVSEEGKNRIEELEVLLAAKPARDWSQVELIEFMKTALGVARAGGLVALDGVPARLDDPFLKSPFRMLVDGADIEIVRSIALARKRTLLADRERRFDMVITGTCGLNSGNSPRVIEAELRAFLPE